MMFNVPQFIDIEDKIAGPLTWRQLLWMIGLGAILLVLFNVLEKGAFYVVAIPTAVLFAALAFYRPNNQPLILYVAYSFMFLFRPKIAVWERPTAHTVKKAEAPVAPKETALKDKRVTLDELKNLARVVDQHGRI